MGPIVQSVLNNTFEAHAGHENSNLYIRTFFLGTDEKLSHIKDTKSQIDLHIHLVDDALDINAIY